MRKPRYLESLGKMLCALAFLSLIPLLASTASAQSGLYLAADVGLARGSTSGFSSEVSRGDIDFDSGLGYSLAVGLGWQGLRLEGEATWRRTDVDGIDYDRLNLEGLGDLEDRVRRLVNDNLNVKGNRTTVGFMANAWYDLDLGVGLAPYVGGGWASTTSVMTSICRWSCRPSRVFLPPPPARSMNSGSVTATGCSPTSSDWGWGTGCSTPWSCTWVTGTWVPGIPSSGGTREPR